MTKPIRVLITGATGAIGGALAREYAGLGCSLVLQGRKADALAELARECVAQGAKVETQVLDMRDHEALTAWLSDVCERAAPDLVIINAGMNTHVSPSGEPEPWKDVEALLEVNLKAALLIVQTVLPAMRGRGSGQIALLSSLAAYFGLPVTPTYCATKAGLKAYGEALRGWLAVEGIRVNVIMPGYVKSPMCDGMPGPKLFLWSPERAARTIRRGLASNKARISFPFPLNWGAWWLTVLPASVSGHIVRWLGYGKND